MTAADERETTAVVTDADDVVRIWSNRRKDVTALRKHRLVTVVAEGIDGRTPWVEATVPRTAWSPVTGIKRAPRQLTPEQRAELAERARQNLGGGAR